MNQFQLKYTSDYWGANGPTLLIQSLKAYCQHEDFFRVLMNHTLDSSTNTTRSIEQKCDDLIIYPEVFFYPYTYINGDLDELFRKNAVVNVSRIIDSYSVHFYGSLTNKYHVGIHDFSLYEFLASQNCPIIYDHVKKNEIKFF